MTSEEEIGNNYSGTGLAIGLIVGDLLNGGIWAVVRVITQGRI